MWEARRAQLSRFPTLSLLPLEGVSCCSGPRTTRAASGRSARGRTRSAIRARGDSGRTTTTSRRRTRARCTATSWTRTATCGSGARTRMTTTWCGDWCRLGKGTNDEHTRSTREAHHQHTQKEGRKLHARTGFGMFRTVFLSGAVSSCLSASSSWILDFYLPCLTVRSASFSERASQVLPDPQVQDCFWAKLLQLLF